jgi:hypothetical protein
MYEIAFFGLWRTESYWESEIEIISAEIAV